jgi:hypothetical protein
MSRGLKEVALQFAALLVGNLICLLAVTSAMGALMSVVLHDKPVQWEFDFLKVFPVIGYFIFPVLASIFAFWLFGFFAFRDHPARSIANLVLCIIMPVATFVLLYIALMPGCWRYWLAGIECSW